MAPRVRQLATNVYVLLDRLPPGPVGGDGAGEAKASEGAEADGAEEGRGNAPKSAFFVPAADGA